MSESLYIYDWPEAAQVNAALSDYVLGLKPEAYTQRSHYFHGRYENLYLDENAHQGLKQVVQAARARAAQILKREEESIRVGFWLNIMNEGDVTTLHCHDDDDELLSAVYYLKVPGQSGLFRLHEGEEIQEVTPKEGRYMFFKPALLHEVTEHKAKQPRISIGMNFGPVT